MSATHEERSGHPISRRGLLAGAAGVVGLGMLGVGHIISARPAAAADGVWGGLENGSIPFDRMVRVDYPGVVYEPDPAVAAINTVDAVYLEPGAARNLVAMLDAYAADTGDLIQVIEGYRSYAVQDYYATVGAAYGTPKPAGTSGHGAGLAIDIRDVAEHIQWIGRRGAEFGWVPLAGDIIHFDYVGPLAGALGGNPLEDGEMWYSNIDDYGTIKNGVAPLRNGCSYIQGADGVLRPVGLTESNARGKAGQTPVAIHGSQLGAIAAAFGVYEVTWDGLEPTPTGRIVYGTNLASARPAW